MRTVFGYIRVSSARQGEGVSLTEQKRAIQDYARKYNYTISNWFEEKETAAKRGRPVFSKMMTSLRRGEAKGVIIHKIDRSARNLKDWSDLAELLDSGIGVYFAHESLDMNARGGRLTADIQAVIASDYIRNLREEALKGLHGRLKQGVYPFKAPLGYEDAGGGKPKTIHPKKGPIVRKLFEKYSTGRYTLHTLLDWARTTNLTNHNGGKISLRVISTILNNPFYTGLMRVKGQLYAGKHEALISSTLFDRVQHILHGRTYPRNVKHDFLYRRFIKCGYCKRSLIGELQKGRVYYRCHTRNCPTTSIREDNATATFHHVVKSLDFPTDSLEEVKNILENPEEDMKQIMQEKRNSLILKKTKLETRKQKLNEALLDGNLESEEYRELKNTLLKEELKTTEEIDDIDTENLAISEEHQKYLELLKTIATTYDSEIPQVKNQILKSMTSNLIAQSKSLYISMVSPFDQLVDSQYLAKCEVTRRFTRTLYPQFDRWVKFSPETGTFCFDTAHTPSEEYLREYDEKKSANLTTPEELYEILKENIYEPDGDES